MPVACKSLMKGIAAGGYAEKLREVLKAAEESTLFLDEVCELPAAAQAPLADLLRECRSAGDAGLRRPARVVAATNRVVKEALAKGHLDKNLHAALCDVFIQMPPLRDRKEDICLLINHFLQQFNAKSEKKVLSVAPEAMDYLFGYGWPGNVIQMENVIERAFALGVEMVIQIDDLPAEIKTAGEISRMH
jgi:DNA-binding NtrC family response regulator